MSESDEKVYNRYVVVLARECMLLARQSADRVSLDLATFVMT